MQDHKQLVADALEMVEFEAAHVVFRQGDAGDKFYIIKEGTVILHKDGKVGRGGTGPDASLDSGVGTVTMHAQGWQGGCEGVGSWLQGARAPSWPATPLVSTHLALTAPFRRWRSCQTVLSLARRR